MSSVITEPLGPRGRRRARMGTALALVVLAALLAVAVVRFANRGEFAGELWTIFIDFENEWPQYLLFGLGNTLRAAVAASVLSVAFGFALTLTRIARNPVASVLGRLWIDLVRTIPLVLLIFFCFVGLPQLDIGVSRFSALVLALVLYNSAVLAEVFRAGIASLDRGQGEASSAIGLTYWQGMRLVILPQAVRRMIPAIIAQVATITKDTSLGYLIGFEELLRRARITGEFLPSNLLQGYIVASVIYFIVIYFISRAARKLEGKQRKKYGARRIEVAGGPEDLDAMGGGADEEEAVARDREVTTSA
jgi:glutamate transport system permease protein